MVIRLTISQNTILDLTLKIFEVDSKNLFDRFPAQSVGSSNTDVLDSPCLPVLITRTSQSRQHESCKSLTLEGFPFVTVNTKEYHSECSGKISRIMRRTL
ncbi:hypothetical protein Tco_1279393 [Tanacetum coccineum]